MLTRAVRRRQNLRHVQHAAEQIQLPWLCPALWSSHTTYTRSNHRPVAPRPSIERSKSAAPLSTNAPRLASAAPSPSLLDPRDPYTPFEYPSQTSKSSHQYRTPPLAPDLSRILMIDSTTAVGPEVLETGKKHSFIRGNAWEVEATLDACLQIHRWDRAITILNQLCTFYAGNEEQLQRLYNKVLEAMVFDHIWNRSSDNITRINGWVENEMKKATVAPNAQTFALKIKAAIATLQGRRRDRTVRRYWDMAKEHNVDWEVASLREILSDSDLGKLSEISPQEIELELDTTEDVGLEESHITVPEDVVSQLAQPNVRETPQKGLGMAALKQSLSLFGDANHLGEWQSLDKADSETRAAYARQRQLQLEQDFLASATDRWRTEHEQRMKMGIAGSVSRGKIGYNVWNWHKELTKSIQAELDKVDEAEAKLKKSEEDRLRTEYGPFLRVLQSDHLAALTATSVITIMTKMGVTQPAKLARLVTDVGRTVEQEIATEAKKRVEERKKAMKSLRSFGTNTTTLLPDPARPQSSDASLSTSPKRYHWSVAQQAKVGSVLCELFFGVAKVSVKHAMPDGVEKSIQQPAFNRTVTYLNGKKLGVVTMHSEVVAMLTKEPVADVIAKQLPMVCKPTPWTQFSEGGYLESQNPVLRVKGSDQAQADYAQAAADRGDLDQLFKGLDVLGATGWRINQDVFKVMVEAWNTGEGIANLPPIDKVFTEPSKPAENASAMEKFTYYQTLQAVNNEKSGIHSNRCFQNFQMEIARAYTNETFYLPHNVDFRGRAYPIPPYLNQMGADNARGLLTFATGRELGDQGFKWLKVHLANVCGYDKASLGDRAKFADDHIDDVRDSVQNPLSGKRWWLKAEDAWQCLATCHELVKAIDSGNPHTFVSHLPIHQDGTCNGLQHYAALGGDIAGARQVNLEPGDKPADVYTGVCELVKADIAQDAANGHTLAKELDGRVTRKIVKQTVMTNVYGVTFRGAMQQVRKQLDALLPDLNERRMGNEAATYIARKIFKGLGKLFEGAHDIQYWFGDCANRITNSISPAQLDALSEVKVLKDGQKVDRRRTKDSNMSQRKMVDQGDFRSTVVWTTPLKLPVVQPYRISRSQKLKTHMATIVLSEPSVTDYIDKRKQLQGFPPNFIHSLDATHMMLSAIKAHEMGLEFSAVHDSFWTHAADIDTLNLLLRDAFIRMHTEDIIGRLAAEFKMRYKGHLYLARIGANSSLAKEIQDYRKSLKVPDAGSTSTKKGTRNHVEKRRQYFELVQEHKRQTLLASADPKERAEGAKMVTAASIFEHNNGEEYLTAKNSLGETALAQIPETTQEPDSHIMEAAMENSEIAEVQDVDMESTLEPLVEAGNEVLDAAQVTDAAVETGNGKNRKRDSSLMPNARLKSTIQRSVVAGTQMWLWLPLTFKPVPKKGDWDVRRLKDSVYFFS